MPYNFYLGELIISVYQSLPLSNNWGLDRPKKVIRKRFRAEVHCIKEILALQQTLAIPKPPKNLRFH